MGEYARCLMIATALSRRVPGLEMHFALSRAAPYAADTPFPTTLLPSSATFHPREVGALIRELGPRVVVFDNAGRTLQLRAARAAGARIVYVSSRRRQRRKAFRLQWMRLLDEHWIAYPRFIAGAPSPLERLKLRALKRPAVRFVDTLLPAADLARSNECLARFALQAGGYVLIVPGGGSAHPGAEDAPAIVAAAARSIARRGVPTLLVGSSGAAGDEPQALLRVAPRLPPAELVELIRTARLVVSNGGDTLLQVLACDLPCVAVPIAHDQSHRIDCCVRAGLALRAELNARAIESAVSALMDKDRRQSGGGPPPDQPRVRNRMEEVLAALTALIAAP
jgi:hypothetical protein